MSLLEGQDSSDASNAGRRVDSGRVTDSRGSSMGWGEPRDSGSPISYGNVGIGSGNPLPWERSLLDAHERVRQVGWLIRLLDVAIGSKRSDGRNSRFGCSIGVRAALHVWFFDGTALLSLADVMHE